MHPFKLPKKENYRFVPDGDGSLLLPHLEEEVQMLISRLQSRKGKYHKVRYRLVYCQSNATEYVIVATRYGKGAEILSTDEHWMPISVSLFRLLIPTLTFVNSYSAPPLFIYESTSFTLMQILGLVARHSRSAYIDQLLKSL